MPGGDSLSRLPAGFLQTPDDAIPHGWGVQFQGDLGIAVGAGLGPPVKDGHAGGKFPAKFHIPMQFVSGEEFRM